MQTPTEDQLAAWKQLQWAAALITSRFRRDLAAAGLSLEQFDVLVHLAWAPSGTLPLHELTASMVVADALSRSGITRLLDRMDRDGLITRTVSTTDRRRFDVSLTPAGQHRFGLARPRRRDRPLLRPAAGPPRRRRARQDPGHPDPGQPEPRPARLTPAGRQRCAPGACPPTVAAAAAQAEGSRLAGAVTLPGSSLPSRGCEEGSEPVPTPQGFRVERCLAEA